MVFSAILISLSGIRLSKPLAANNFDWHKVRPIGSKSYIQTFNSSQRGGQRVGERKAVDSKQVDWNPMTNICSQAIKDLKWLSWKNT